MILFFSGLFQKYFINKVTTDNLKMSGNNISSYSLLGSNPRPHKEMGTALSSFLTTIMIVM